MKKWSLTLLAIAALAITVLLTRTLTLAEEKNAANAFASTTIDLGVVVSDVDKSAAFYKEAIGFQEQKGFSVPADLATDAGLTNNKGLDIRVFALGNGDTATKLKLMKVAGADSKKNENEYIHSEYGFRYITIHVTDMNAAITRLEKAGVKPVAKSPVPLGKGGFLTLIRDPDGNIVELVGPKK